MKNYDFLRETPILFKKYKVLKKLGEGGWGSVYLGKTIINGELVAIKAEPKSIRKPLLESEAFILEHIKGFGIPEVLSFGKNKHFNILVEHLLGENLYDIFNKKGGKLSWEEICLIAIQVLERIEYVHSKGYIHRDIKPDNFCIGKPDKNVIYIIDFGLCKKYISSKTKNHIKFGFTGKITGTLRFASANALRGGEQSRKDDLISIGYMIIFFMKKNLPWQFIKAKNGEKKHALIYRMKRIYSPELLCLNLPKQMKEYMDYVQSLTFAQNPNYKYIQNLFKSILKDRNKNPDNLLFSWIKPSDLPYLKKYVNPTLRKASPQQRLLKNIREISKEKQIRESSANSFSNNTCESAISNIDSNMKIIKDISKDDFGSDNNINIFNSTSKKETNTMMVNCDKIIENKLFEDFDKIDNEINNNMNNNNINNNINKDSNCSLINYEKIKNKIKQKDEEKEVADIIMNIKINKEKYYMNNQIKNSKLKNEVNGTEVKEKNNNTPKNPKLYNNCIKYNNDFMNKSNDENKKTSKQNYIKENKKLNTNKISNINQKTNNNNYYILTEPKDTISDINNQKFGILTEQYYNINSRKHEKNKEQKNNNHMMTNINLYYGNKVNNNIMQFKAIENKNCLINKSGKNKNFKVIKEYESFHHDEKIKINNNNSNYDNIQKNNFNQIPMDSIGNNYLSMEQNPIHNNANFNKKKFNYSINLMPLNSGILDKNVHDY